MLNHFRDLSSIVHTLDQHFSILITETNGTILYINDKSCELSKYERAEVSGQKHSMFNSGMFLRWGFQIT
ncbi:PAS domain-containing protein [Domibacillus iocasae]|uniref:PAS domain-containing protein n=1 Tax=Domibacillus iocasae TaxID=1714016 RepID=UPI00114D14E3